MIVCFVEWSKSSTVEVGTIIRFRKNRLAIAVMKVVMVAMIATTTIITALVTDECSDDGESRGGRPAESHAVTHHYIEGRIFKKVNSGTCNT